MINKFLNILFPESCPVCQQSSSEHATAPLCPECWQSIVPYEGPICKKCGKPLLSEASTICGECLTDEPAFDWARSFGIYENILKKGINLLKYHGKKRLSKPLSNFLCYLDLPAAHAIIPVPVHNNRLRQRGFNQSALLGRYLAKTLQIELILNCLVKIKDTLPQVGLRSKERNENIKRSFSVRNKDLIVGKKILLLDDVITTGATIRECSKVLKKAGAEDIYVIALAHGIQD